MAVKELQLVPVGPVLGTFLKELEAPIAQVLGVEAYLGKATLGQPTFAFNKDRNQYHTTAIMRRLLTLKDPGAPLIIGVADVDLFVPERFTTVVIGPLRRLPKELGWLGTRASPAYVTLEA